MAINPVQTSEIKNKIKPARTAPMLFAFNPGNSADEHYFLLAKTGQARTMGQQARKEGPGNKAAYGTLAVDGSTVVLYTDSDMNQLAQKMKNYLPSINAVVVRPASDAITPPDTAADDEAAAAPSEEEEGVEDARLARKKGLAKLLKAQKTQISALGPRATREMKSSLLVANSSLDADDLETASHELKKVALALEGLDSEAPDTEAAEERAEDARLARKKQLLKLFKAQKVQVLGAVTSITPTAKQHLLEAHASLEADNIDEATRALKKVAQLLASLESET